MKVSRLIFLSYVAHVKYLHAKIAKHGTAAVCILDMVGSEDDLDQSKFVNRNISRQS